MYTKELTWIPLTRKFDQKINEALLQQHHAAQFIALAGRHLIAQQADDSNTNMHYIPKGNMLLGNALPNGMQLALQLTNLTLKIRNQDSKTIKTIYLQGKTKEQAFKELTQALLKLGVDVTSFRNELHYHILSHALDKGAKFSVDNESDFIENANYRNNAEIVLHEIAGVWKNDEPIRVWPHHFDTGVFYAISKNKKGEATQTIGVGWAIPDSMIDEPYYYLSFWSEKPPKSLKSLLPLPAGQWMMPKWNGAVLKHSEITKIRLAKGQYELVLAFYHAGIEILKDLF